MSFNSIQFLIFFPIVVYFYFLISPQYRWLFLLLASCYFYMCFIPVYIFVLFSTIIIDYCAAIYIEKSHGTKRKFFLWASIISTCLILFIFKYFNFFNMSLAAVAQRFHWDYSVDNLSLILPIGLSFHTFQSLSYVIEVYRGRQKAERHFGIYALYVMFFPQLVAGPIERPSHLLPQFYKTNHFEYSRVKRGLRLMLWGFFKKIVIADNLAVLVDKVYASPLDFHGGTLLLATYFFAFQIYYDFSAYSDIAIGCARILGYELMMNFRQPYLSSSISEFWKRWHISLSTWFRDYLYIPLGGNKVSEPRWVLNIGIVFIVSGLWHGANGTFIIWGALHAFYYIAAKYLPRLFGNTQRRLLEQRLYPTLFKLAGVLITFNLTALAWIFFRSKSFSDAKIVISKISTSTWLSDNLSTIEPYAWSFLLWGALVFLTETGMFLKRKHLLVFAASKKYLRWGFYYTVILLIFILGNFNERQFIYFQF